MPLITSIHNFSASQTGCRWFVFQVHVSVAPSTFLHDITPACVSRSELMPGQNRNAKKRLLMWRHGEDSDIQYMCKHFFSSSSFKIPLPSPPPPHSKEVTITRHSWVHSQIQVSFFSPYFFLKTLSLFFFLFSFFLLTHISVSSGDSPLTCRLAGDSSSRDKTPIGAETTEC